MLRACIIDFKENWDKNLPLVEFAHNNSFYSSIFMAPYEALYGRRCRSSIGWYEMGETSLLVPILFIRLWRKLILYGIACKQPIVGKTLMPIIGEVIYSLKNVIKCI